MTLLDCHSSCFMPVAELDVLDQLELEVFIIFVALHGTKAM